MNKLKTSFNFVSELNFYVKESCINSRIINCGKRCLPSPLPGGVKCGVPSPMNGGLSPDPSENGLRLEFYGAFFC